jgi:hypothetical protein
VPGPRGPIGPTGPQGDVGPQGAKGDTGSQGTKGDTGDPGPIGPPGPQGVEGPAGTNGAPGTPGTPGIQGPVGPQGAKGDKGDTGAQGIQGATGATGAQGVKGDPGVQGVPGTPGATGAQGAKGDKGDTGAQGVVGPAGPTGSTGAQGPAGTPGTQGPQGVQGPVGPMPPIGGLDTQVQWNNGGLFAGDPAFTWYAPSALLSVTNLQVDNGLAATPTFRFKNASNTGFFSQLPSVVGFSAAGQHVFSFASNAIFANHGATICFGDVAARTVGSAFRGYSTGLIDVDSGTLGQYRDMRMRDITLTRNLNTPALPTADPAVAGQVWLDKGTLRISGAPAVASSVPGGATTQVQFNDAGAFAGDTAMTWDKGNDRLSVGVAPLATVVDGTTINLHQTAGEIFWGPRGSADIGMARNAAGVAEINSGDTVLGGFGQYRDLKLRNITTTGTGSTFSGTTQVGNLQTSADAVINGVAWANQFNAMANGTAAAPAYTFYSYPTTGFYAFSANAVRWTFGGTAYIQQGVAGIFVQPSQQLGWYGDATLPRLILRWPANRVVCCRSTTAKWVCIVI